MYFYALIRIPNYFYLNNYTNSTHIMYLEPYVLKSHEKCKLIL